MLSASASIATITISSITTFFGWLYNLSAAGYYGHQLLSHLIRDLFPNNKPDPKIFHTKCKKYINELEECKKLLSSFCTDSVHFSMRILIEK